MSIASSNTNRNCIKIRTVFLGDQSVGKSSIIDRYTTNRYEESHSSTVGIDFNVRDIPKNGLVYRLQMWDTAGQERYRSLIPTYLKNAQCAIFVFDVTKQSSLQNIKSWLTLFKEHQQAPGILVGNKTDLTAARKVSKEQAEVLAASLKLQYAEVSAKTGKKVNDLFEQINKQEKFVQSTRQKVNELKTIEQRGLQEDPKDKKNEKPITLRSKTLQFAKNIKCCNSN